MATRTNDPGEPNAVRTSKLKANAQGYWEIHWSESGRSQRVSCKTKDAAEAKRRLSEWRDDVRLVLAQAQQARALTVDEICERYLTLIESQGKSSSNRYVLVPIRRELGGYVVEQLSEGVLSDYQDQRGVSSGTLRRELNSLNAALRWAAKKKLIGRSVLPEIDLPPGGAPRQTHMERDEEQWFWDQAVVWGHRQDRSWGSRDAAFRVMVFIAIGLATAARRGAIYQLTWDRVDLSHGIIDFRVPGQRTTRKRKVVVPISDRLMPILQEAAALAPKGSDGHPIGRVLGDTTCIRRAFVAFTAAIGKPEVTPHVLRHTWATLASRNGMPEAEIAAVMGDTIKTVHDTYVHYRPDYLRNTINHHTQHAQLSGVT